MDAVAHAVRIYGSDDSYGAPREAPTSEPLKVADLPREGDRCLIWFGSVPDTVRQPVRERGAMAAALAGWLFGGGDGEEISLDEAIQRHLARFPDALDERSWYVTFDLQRSIQIDVAALEDATVQDIEPIEDVVRREAPSAFDLMTASIAPLVDASIFSGRVRETVYLAVEGWHRPIFIPQMDARLELSTGRSLDSFPLEAIRTRLTDLSERRQHWSPWLRRVAHWYSAMLATDDDLKRFLWGFVALEALTHKLFERVREPALKTLQITAANAAVVSSTVIEQLAWDKDRTPLASRFALVASYLSPGTAEADVIAFRAAKKARDDMAHGNLVSDDQQLPIQHVRDLLPRYIEAALQLP